MTSDSKSTIQIACMLGHRGFSVTSVEFKTPDGRTWSADAQSDGAPRSQRVQTPHRERSALFWLLTGLRSFG